MIYSSYLYFSITNHQLVHLCLDILSGFFPHWCIFLKQKLTFWLSVFKLLSCLFHWFHLLMYLLINLKASLVFFWFVFFFVLPISLWKTITSVINGFTGHCHTGDYISHPFQKYLFSLKEDLKTCYQWEQKKEPLQNSFSIFSFIHECHKVWHTWLPGE